jgi:hypothetical protein
MAAIGKVRAHLTGGFQRCPALSNVAHDRFGRHRDALAEAQRALGLFRISDHLAGHPDADRIRAKLTG